MKQTLFAATVLTLFATACATTGNKPKTDGTATKDSKNDMPTLTKPEIRAVWVPDKIEDDKFIAGHFIYVIEKPSTWTKP